MKHKMKGKSSVPKRKPGNMHKASSPALGINMGRTGMPMMGAPAPMGMPGAGMQAC